MVLGRGASRCFTLFLLVVVAAMVWQAAQWPHQAALFPLCAGIPALVLLVVQLGLSFRSVPATAPVGEPLLDPTEHPEIAAAEEIDPDVAKRRALVFAGWIIGFSALIWGIGFPYGGTGATVAYLLFAARERWTMAAAFGAGTALMFWGVEQGGVLRFPSGALW
jgi:hypothetical protein